MEKRFNESSIPSILLTEYVPMCRSYDSRLTSHDMKEPKIHDLVLDQGESWDDLFPMVRASLEGSRESILGAPLHPRRNFQLQIFSG